MENQNQQHKPFCVAPFYNFYYKGSKNESLLQPCCESRSGTTSDSQGDYNTFWNGNFMKEVRQTMLEGKPHEICTRCIEVEKAGGVNTREGYRNILAYAEKVKGPIEFNVDTGNQFNSPLAIDFRASNLCNLKCRMCHASSSSEIAKESVNYTEEYKTLGLKPFTKHLYVENKDLNLFIDQVPLNNVVRAKFLGGEPLLQEDVYRGLESIANDTVNAKEVKISFTTNATNFPKRFIDLIGKFNTITMRISLDGIGDTFEYVRTNGNWNKIKSNIFNLLDKHYTKSEITIGFSFIIQAYSIFNIRSILDFCKELESKGYKNLVEPFFSPIEQDYMSTAILDDEDLNFVINELEEFKQQYPTQQWTDNIKNIILNFDQKRKIDLVAAKEEFKTYTNTLDSIRGTSLSSLNERFKKYI